MVLYVFVLAEGQDTAAVGVLVGVGVLVADRVGVAVGGVVGNIEVTVGLGDMKLPGVGVRVGEGVMVAEILGLGVALGIETAGVGVGVGEVVGLAPVGITVAAGGVAVGCPPTAYLLHTSKSVRSAK